MRSLFTGIVAASGGEVVLEPFIPNAFAFTAQTDLEQDEDINSAAVQITAEVDGSETPVSITGGQYQIATDPNFTNLMIDWTSATGTIRAGEYIRVRCRTAIGWVTQRTATVIIGMTGVSRSAVFSVTTRQVINVLLNTVGVSSWVPTRKWHNSNNLVEVIGGGGGGACGDGANQCGAGGGGGYARKANIAYNGSSFAISVGAGGAGGLTFTSSFDMSVNQNGKNGGNTWFSTTAIVNASGGLGGQVLNAGGSGVPGVGGAGGARVAGDSGNSGGAGAIRTVVTCAAQNGGGGAGGPGGKGGDGGMAGYNGCALPRNPGGGGEGAGNSTAGANGGEGQQLGGAAGAGGSSAGAGGNGGTVSAGFNGTNWAALYSSSGGSGGGGGGGAGGLYGAGGSNSYQKDVAGHAGARGAIHIRY